MKTRRSTNNIRLRIGVVFVVIAGLAGLVSECSSKYFCASYGQEAVKKM
jgi:hypothetical protein